MGLFLPTAGASSQNHSLKDQNQGEEPFGAGGLYPSLTEEEMEAKGSLGVGVLLNRDGTQVSRFPVPGLLYCIPIPTL